MTLKSRWQSRTLALALVILSISVWGYAAELFIGSHALPALPATTRNTGTPPPNCSDTPANPNCNILGFTCAFGNIVTTAGPAVITAIKTRDPTSPAANVGVADTKCNWAGDTDGDFAGAPPPALFESGMDPLVSDPTPKDTVAACATAPCGTPNGGGVIFDVMFFNSNRTINGFETIISWDPAVLNLQSFDQAGLLFGGNVGCPPATPSCTLGLANTIDNNAGTARLAQTVEGVITGGAGTTVRLFRLRFNVVGAGSTNVVFTKSVITFAVGITTGPLDHLDANMVFSTDKVFNVLNNAIPGTAACRTTAPPCGLGFNASYTFSPSPPLASGLVTFTATAKCQNCTGTLSYFWDFSSLERHSYVLKNQANGPIVSIDPKVTSINRVTLYVKDQATRIHNVTATRGLPLDVFVSGPSTLAGNAPGNFNGYWLGGVANYTGNWIFCPLATSLGFPAICNPVDSQLIGATPGTSSAIVGESWAFAGLYTTNSLTITDGAGRSVASYPNPVTVTRFWMVNITAVAGVVPPAFTVGVTANTTSPAAGKAVNVTATITYDPTYDPAVQATDFIYTFVWGDGTANTVVSSTLIGSAAHVYATGGTFTVKVMVTENTPFIAVSSIQENGYSPAITASAGVSLVGVVPGLDGALDWNGLAGTTWGSWAGLAGSSGSAVALCSSLTGFELVVRGGDNGIYHKSFTAGAWSAAWDSPGGLTSASPSCAVLGSTLYVAVRGIDNGVYVNSRPLPTGSWGSWVSLNGFTPSAPAITATSNPSRLDIVVRGNDDGVYHKANVGGAGWSAAWDKEATGIIKDSPVAISDGDGVAIVVSGPGSTLNYNKFFFATGWSTWTSLGFSNTTPAATRDSSGTIHVIIRDLDNNVKHIARPFGGTFAGQTYIQLGGIVVGRPTVAVTGTLLVVLARGVANIIYSNISTNGGTTWLGWTSTKASSTIDPSLPYQ